MDPILWFLLGMTAVLLVMQLFNARAILNLRGDVSRITGVLQGMNGKGGLVEEVTRVRDSLHVLRNEITAPLARTEERKVRLQQELSQLQVQQQKAERQIVVLAQKVGALPMIDGA